MNNTEKMSKSEVIDKILALKKKYGKNLVIMAHHYQQDEIVDLADFKGDSLELSRIAAEQKDAEYIVFCGVDFMAESARILCGKKQIIIHPDPRSGCPMADFANIWDVSRAWDDIAKVCDINKVVPVVYVNSDSKIKAFCGENGGITCTSGNAEKILKWAFAQGEKVLFIPDEHLGRNTSLAMGIPEEKMVLYDPTLPLGGNTEDILKNARIILWKGYCHVHTMFRPSDVKRARTEYPGCQVVVHPECPNQVVQLVDKAGSTAWIIKYIETLAKGTTVVIGTEVHLVDRLKKQFPDLNIHPLVRSACPNMNRITLYNLYECMVEPGAKNVVTVSEDIIMNARKSLQKMLDIS